jgi:hypothetical protein
VAVHATIRGLQLDCRDGTYAISTNICNCIRACKYACIDVNWVPALHSPVHVQVHGLVQVQGGNAAPPGSLWHTEA